MPIEPSQDPLPPVAEGSPFRMDRSQPLVTTSGFHRQNGPSASLLPTLKLLRKEEKKPTCTSTMLYTARTVVPQLLRGRLAQATTTTPSAFYSPAALRRLASTLAILEQREGKLNHGSLSAITAAKKIGGAVHGFVAGSSIKSVADEAATADGVEKIIAVDSGAYDKVGLTMHPLDTRFVPPCHPPAGNRCSWMSINLPN